MSNENGVPATRVHDVVRRPSMEDLISAIERLQRYSVKANGWYQYSRKAVLLSDVIGLVKKEFEMRSKDDA